MAVNISEFGCWLCSSRSTVPSTSFSFQRISNLPDEDVSLWMLLSWPLLSLMQNCIKLIPALMERIVGWVVDEIVPVKMGSYEGFVCCNQGCFFNLAWQSYSFTETTVSLYNFFGFAWFTTVSLALFFFITIAKVFILVRGLDTKIRSHEILRFSWNFLIS